MSPRVLCELLVDVVAHSDPVGSILVEILHSVEGRDIEQGCSNFEINLPFLRLLSISYLCLYLACFYFSYSLLA